MYPWKFILWNLANIRNLHKRAKVYTHKIFYGYSAYCGFYLLYTSSSVYTQNSVLIISVQNKKFKFFLCAKFFFFTIEISNMMIDFALIFVC